MNAGDPLTFQQGSGMGKSKEQLPPMTRTVPPQPKLDIVRNLPTIHHALGQDPF